MNDELVFTASTLGTVSKVGLWQSRCDIHRETPILQNLEQVASYERKEKKTSKELGHGGGVGYGIAKSGRKLAILCIQIAAEVLRSHWTMQRPSAARSCNSTPPAPKVHTPQIILPIGVLRLIGARIARQ